jgi:hypothetical protein
MIIKVGKEVPDHNLQHNTKKKSMGQNLTATATLWYEEDDVLPLASTPFSTRRLRHL